MPTKRMLVWQLRQTHTPVSQWPGRGAQTLMWVGAKIDPPENEPKPPDEQINSQSVQQPLLGFIAVVE
jgi:hypothetical protein